MSKTKKKAAKPAQKPNFTDAKSLAKSLAPKQRPLSKATTAELTAVLETRGLVVSKPGEISKDFPLVDKEISCLKNNVETTAMIAEQKELTIRDLCERLENESMFTDEDLRGLGIMVQNITGKEVVFDKTSEFKDGSLKEYLESVLNAFKQNNLFVLRVVKTLRENLG